MITTIPAVKFFLTEVGKSPSGNPVVVGWDFCKCGYHISICQCVGGPSEPRYITAMREKDAALAKERELATIAAATPVVSAPAKVAVPLATEPLATATEVCETDHDKPYCFTCHKPVDESNADRNDDGTYTCWDCQEAS